MSVALGSVATKSAGVPPVGNSGIESLVGTVAIGVLLGVLLGVRLGVVLGVAIGNVKVKLLPLLGRLCAQILPPWAWMICLAMANPNPVPPPERARSAL